MLENNKFDENILKVLACPLTKTPLKFSPKTMELISEKVKLAFPIINNIPVLLIDKARKL